jgi:hypothetical protein
LLWLINGQANSFFPLQESILTTRFPAGFLLGKTVFIRKRNPKMIIVDRLPGTIGPYLDPERRQRQEEILKAIGLKIPLDELFHRAQSDDPKEQLTDKELRGYQEVIKVPVSTIEYEETVSQS